MKSNIDLKALKNNVKRIIESTNNNTEAFQQVMQFIHDEVNTYKWIGIYWLYGNELKLGPFVGAETDHTTINVGKGVCGQAVADNQNQVISDVRELDNYLACSIETRSEIVVLIKDKQGRILGQIDADGHTVNDFDHSDEEFLEYVAELVAGRCN